MINFKRLFNPDRALRYIAYGLWALLMLSIVFVPGAASRVLAILG